MNIDTLTFVGIASGLIATLFIGQLYCDHFFNNERRAESEWVVKSRTLTDHIYAMGGFDINNRLTLKFAREEYIAYEMYIQEGGDCDVKYYLSLLYLTDFWCEDLYEPEDLVEQ